MAYPSVEQRFAEVANSACLRQISGEINFGTGIAADTLLMSEAGLMFGIPSGTVQRLGREGVQLLAQSIIGGQQLKEDIIVVAVGGRIPGCRTILVSKNPSGTGESVATELNASGWTEVEATNAPNAALFRRIFVRRNAAGQSIVLNLYAGSTPDSDVNLFSTMWPIPANVLVPNGF